MRLRIQLRAGAWSQAGAALNLAEAILGLIFDNGKDNIDKGVVSTKGDAKAENTVLPRWSSITAGDVHTLSREYSQLLDSSNPRIFESKPEEENAHSDPAHASLVIHTLLSGAIFFTFSGNIRAAEQRLVALHALVDSGALQGFKDGIVQVHFPYSPPFLFLGLRVTHANTYPIDPSPTALSPGGPNHPPTHTSPPYIPCQCHCEKGPSRQKSEETAMG